MFIRKRRVEVTLDTVQGYISSVSRRVGKKNILLSEEDIVQEASVVLWKVLKAYPKKPEKEIIPIFKVSLTRRLASLFRPAYIRKAPKLYEHSAYSLDVAMEKMASDGGGAHTWVQERDLATPGMVAWGFYTKQLKAIGRILGKDRLKDMIMANYRGNWQSLDRDEKEVRDVLEAL